ncbi:MAG TPA: HIT family protein, partial [Alphaproteobacteria bacterium]|nr:HIT family protein [Alphaproteobacteria bacterium]
MSEAFILHPTLAADTIQIAHWPLCEVLLMDDSRFTWVILVPRRAGATEWFDLGAEDA